MFNSSAVRNPLHRDIKAALDEVAKKHGITIDLGVFRYSVDEFKLTMTGKTDAAKSRELVNESFGVSVSSFPINTRIQIRNTIYTVKAINPSRPKHIYDVETHTGKRYRCSHNFLKSGTLKA